MLSTQQSIREQVDALTSTIYTHLSTISQESKAAIKKADEGDQSVNADQVVSHLVRNLTADLHQHDQVKLSSEVVSVEYGSQITPGDFPQESSEEVKEVQLSAEEKILQKVQTQDNEARQVISELFEIYEQMISEMTKVMIDQKSQLDLFETNGMLQKSSSQRNTLIKSKSSLLLEGGSDYPQNLVSNLDTSMREFITKQMDQVNKDVDKKTQFIDKYLNDLKKSSQKAVNYLLTLKNPEMIVTRWTERMFNTGSEMKLIYPAQSYIDKIKELDGQTLNKIALKKLWHLNMSQYNHLSCCYIGYHFWNFEFKDNQKLNFNQSGQILNAQTLEDNKEIRSIQFHDHHGYNFLTGLIFLDKDQNSLLKVGSCSRLIKTVYLDANEKIIGVRAHYNPSYNHTLGDIQFLVGKVQSD